MSDMEVQKRGPFGLLSGAGAGLPLDCGAQVCYFPCLASSFRDLDTRLPTSRDPSRSCGFSLWDFWDKFMSAGMFPLLASSLRHWKLAECLDVPRRAAEQRGHL